MAIYWDCEHSSQPLANQVTLARQQLEKTGKITSAVSQFVRKADHDVIYSDETNLNRNRFEFYFYQRLDQQLHKRGIYLVERDEHRRLDDELISKKDWQTRDIWLKKAALPKLQTPITEIAKHLRRGA
jgi:spermidine synthase